ncbi:MAG TPA: hypothetical protein VD996_13615 [Chitinophagaceae bacterium]|nr:hypothetical protein [Chitinophagaceae bacterium]
MILISMLVAWMTMIMPENVKLLTFTARTDSNKNILEWRTSNEINMREIIVERSEDGALFKGIAWITPKGAVKGPGTYRYTDACKAPEVYYRLRMVEANGKDHVSKVITLITKS